jgi:cytochrome c oxidase cbb3-type subunit 1
VILLFFVSGRLLAVRLLLHSEDHRPAHRSALSLLPLGFWTLAILGGWTGMQKYMGGPLPCLDDLPSVL